MADASITVSADASAVERAAAVAKTAWRDVGSSITSAMGSAAQAIVNDLAQVVTAQGRVNFGSQLEQVRSFERATAQLAIASGRGLEQVRREAEATGIEIGKRPQEVAAWSQEVGRLTGNFEGAEKSIKAFSGLANLTGRSVDDYKSLASHLSLIGVTGEKASSSIGVIVAQSKELGNQGGIASFTDQIDALSDVLTRFSGTGATSIEKMSALSGVLTKGLNPAAAKRVEGQLFGEITGDTFGWSRYLGREITDEHGQVSDPTAVLRDIQQKFQKTYGRNAGRMAQIQFGAEAGAALMHADFGQVDRIAALKPSGDVAAAQKAFNDSDAGKRDVAQAELAKSANQLLNSSTLLGSAANALQQFAAHNPITSTFLTGMFSGALGNFMTQFGGSLSKIVGGSGGGGAVGGIARLVGAGALGTIGSAAAVTGAGIYGIHRWEDAAKERHDLEEKARESAADSALQQRRMAIQRANAALKGLEGLSPQERGEAINATSAMFLRAKDGMEALRMSHGGGFAEKAISDELRREGVNDQDVAKLAAAVADALSRTVIQVHNASDTPVTAVARSSNSSSAGDQSQD